MASSLDQILEPGERVLERATHFGMNRNWDKLGKVWFGAIAIFTIFLWGNDYKLWQVDLFHILLIFWLLMLAGAILVFLSFIFGKYSADAIVTTHRILVRNERRETGDEELTLDNVANVKFHPGLFDFEEFVTVSGRQGEILKFRKRGGTHQFAAAVAEAAKLTHSLLPTPIKQAVIKISKGAGYIFVIFGLIIIYLILPFEIIHNIIYDQPYFLPIDRF